MAYDLQTQTPSEKNLTNHRWRREVFRAQHQGLGTPDRNCETFKLTWHIQQQFKDSST